MYWNNAFTDVPVLRPVDVREVGRPASNTPDREELQALLPEAASIELPAVRAVREQVRLIETKQKIIQRLSPSEVCY